MIVGLLTLLLAGEGPANEAGDPDVVAAVARCPTSAKSFSIHKIIGNASRAVVTIDCIVAEDRTSRDCKAVFELPSKSQAGQDLIARMHGGPTLVPSEILKLVGDYQPGSHLCQVWFESTDHPYPKQNLPWVLGETPNSSQIPSVAPPRPYSPPVLTPTSPMPRLKPVAVVTNPGWVRQPEIGDLMNYYPPADLDAGIEGQSVMDCIVTDEGTLTNCHVVSETPAGRGFGAAELKLATRFRMRTQTVDGQPTAGAHVQVPIAWRISSPPPSPDPTAH